MKKVFTLIAIALLTGCTVHQTAPRIALIAPFEGRYREVGYNALYAARLALADAESGVQLLPLDDGGSVVSAAQRLSAVVSDRSVIAALLLGPFVTAPEARAALVRLPAIVVGFWANDEHSDFVFIAASNQIPSLITPSPTLSLMSAAAQAEPLLVNEIGGLENFQTLLTTQRRSAILVTSGHPASAHFVHRYTASAEFAPRPNHLAELTYDLTAWLVFLCMQADCTRETIKEYLAHDRFASAHNGVIAFGADGFWIDAPLNAYRIESGALLPVSLDDVVNER